MRESFQAGESVACGRPGREQTGECQTVVDIVLFSELNLVKLISNMPPLQTLTIYISHDSYSIHSLLLAQTNN